MQWRTTNPPTSGKYIVKTKTLTQGRTNRFESTWNGKSWGFTNQVFVAWLDESEN